MRIGNKEYISLTNLARYADEDDLKERSNEVRNLKKIKTRDDRIEELEYDLNDANETIDELEDKLSKLQKIVDYFKELWKNFIEFLTVQILLYQ